jgi:hypothetical protein
MEILKDYKDKAYITSILCELSYGYYSTIYNISLLPTILGSSILTILNSSEIKNDILKIINISINGLNTIILSLVNSYRLNDRINSFHNSKIKFTKLNHLLESILNKNSGEMLSIDKNIIENIINDYDKIYEDIPYQFPNHIRQKVIKRFGGKFCLPNSLMIDYNNSIKIDYTNNIRSDVIATNV